MCSRAIRLWPLTLGVLLVLQSCGVSPSNPDGPQSRSKSEGGHTRSPKPAGSAQERQPEEPAILEVEVLRELPHDPSSYTQGLLIYQGSVFESRGRYGHSGVAQWLPESGEIVRSVDLEDRLFGEGLARVGSDLWQLTWQSGVALRWRLADFELEQRIRFPGEGWGLAYDGQRLIMSDGTHELKFLDPERFELLGKLTVWRGSLPQDRLNELEYVPDQNALFANVYETDEIVRIDLATGMVTGIADLSGLLSDQELRSAEVLNGIAYWPDRETFLVTGKYWPKSFEVRFQE